MIYPNSEIDIILNSEFSRLKPGSFVLDVGTSQRFAKDVGQYRQLLEKVNYKALGYQSEMIYGTDNCDYDGDIHKLKFKSKTVDVVLCFEVIEHVTSPQVAVNELRRIVKSGGKVILTTPFLLPYHGKAVSLTDFSHSGYPDFWRFTYQGLEYLFRDFSKVQIYPFSNTLGYFRFVLLQHRLYQLDRLFGPAIAGNATYRHLVVAVK